MVEQDCRYEMDLRREMVRLGRWLYRLGYVPGTSGNLSVRLDFDTLLATPTGVNKHMLRSSDLVIVDLDGRQVAGSRKVTSEIGMHLAIYRHRPDVEAVVHAHPPIATAFACAGRALDEMFCQEAVMTLGSVPLAEYATTGTDEVADSLIPLLPGHDAILMANHGAVSYGLNLLDAFNKMETLEHLAQIRLAMRQLGCERTINVEETERLRRARERYLQNATCSGGRLSRLVP